MSVVVVGAGPAGVALTIELRKLGYMGSITLVGDEEVTPYQRPPLSKALLKGDADVESLMLRPRSWYGRNGIDFRLRVRAPGIDRSRRSVLLSGMSPLNYEHLVLATGARARLLEIPGAELHGVLSLRTSVDAGRLRSEIRPGTKVAFIGAGYVGMETAASARSLNAEVVVFECASRILARAASPPLSAFLTRLHQANGVIFELAAHVKSFRGREGRVRAVELVDGRLIACDVAVVGVGATPNTELATACGLVCENGVIVDNMGRTSDPSIFAIEDVSNRHLERYTSRVRLESVPNALDQARRAAAGICGKACVADEVPWFWSDQYETKLQIAGLSLNSDNAILRGHPKDGKFSVVHLRANQIEAVEAINVPSDFVVAKALIASAARLGPVKIADPTVSLKEACI